MDLVFEIQRGFANIPIGKYKEIPLAGACSVWVYRTDNGYGVAVDMPNETKVSERFATARMYTTTVNVDGIRHFFLVLENTVELFRNEFAAVCAQFSEPGLNGLARAELCLSPSEWWARWKMLLGNSVREKTTHGVLGELLVYLTLLKSNSSVVWQGPTQKSHDIETEAADYEVKSTIARYGTSITISSQYQLEVQEGKSLNLLFCRFEQVETGGMSINMLASDITANGIDGYGFERKLAGLGFEEGCSARDELFILHDEIRAYIVDDVFPKITGKSFAGGMMPERIIQLTYQIDLTSLPAEIFKT